MPKLKRFKATWKFQATTCKLSVRQYDVVRKFTAKQVAKGGWATTQDAGVDLYLHVLDKDYVSEGIVKIDRAGKLTWWKEKKSNA